MESGVEIKKHIDVKIEELTDVNEESMIDTYLAPELKLTAEKNSTNTTKTSKHGDDFANALQFGGTGADCYNQVGFLGTKNPNSTSHTSHPIDYGSHHGHPNPNPNGMPTKVVENAFGVNHFNTHV